MNHDIDHLFEKVFQELMALMTEDPRNIKQSTYLSYIAKYLERIFIYSPKTAVLR